VRAQEFIAEINFPDELDVSDTIQDYFIRRGYSIAGEGRDQIAFESPRGTVVKVLGIGDTEREDIVKEYVHFFLQNQKNPYYPRIYSTGEFTVEDETYFVYEMEHLRYIANDEDALDYLQKLMSTLEMRPAQLKDFVEKTPVPAELHAQEIKGLVQATQAMAQAIGGNAPLDLSQVENLGRRSDGHIVIMDPYSL